LPEGFALWGSRTLDGFRHPSTEWAYVTVGRMALFLEKALAEGLRWADSNRTSRCCGRRSAKASGAFFSSSFVRARSGEIPQMRC
ncbi:MAG: hypothetical protein ABW003_27370, partial [Microvirga sp.]